MRTVSLLLFGLVVTMVSILVILQGCSTLFDGGVCGEMQEMVWGLFDGKTASPSAIIPVRSSANTPSLESKTPTNTGAVVLQKGGYFQYQTGILGNGEQLLLFFTDAECASCANIDSALKSFYRSTRSPYSTYRVPMSSFPSLVSRFSATSGAVLLMGPSGEFLSALELSASGSIVPALSRALQE